MVYPPIIVKNKMKACIVTALLIIIIGNIGAVDIESYQFIDYLRGISVPGRPEIYEDSVVFTAPSSFNRVGISFAYEGYAKVYWFRQLLLPRDPLELAVLGKNAKNASPNTDSGILFHVQTVPNNLKNLDYRMVIGGLWTVDPLNPLTVTGSSGITESRVTLPAPNTVKSLVSGTPQGAHRFLYQGPPGETVTVGGSFNNWDPFMYILNETSPGLYTLALPLPPGSHQYVFFCRGEQIPDLANAKSLYTRDGRIISEIVVP